MLGKALMRGASAYFGYREAKKQKKIELDENLWKLDQDKIKAISALQIALFNTTWNVLSQSADPNEHRLTDDDLRSLERATQTGTAEQTRFLLSWEEDKFRDYPPYWFYRGEAALRCGDEEEARNCLDQFDHASGDVLIRDPYKVQAAKYRIRLNPGASPEFLKSQLAVIRRHAEEWADLLFYAVTSYAIGERTQGIDAVRFIMYKGWESELSPILLRAMESDHFDPAELLAGMDVTGFDHWQHSAPAQLDALKTDEQERARKAVEERSAKEEEERKRKETAERSRREQQEREDQARLDRLHAEAAVRERELMAQLERERAELEALERQERERKEAEARARAQKEAEVRARREQQEREDRLRKEEERLRVESAERERELKKQIEQERARKAMIEQANAILTAGFGAAVGSTVMFGQYVQNMKTDYITKKTLFGGEKTVKQKVPDVPTPIEWLVLANEGGKTLLISKYGLECKPYHHTQTAIMWEKSDLREWLNGEFLSKAFNAAEQARIVQVHNENTDNAQYGTNCGKATNDSVFCLSIDEAHHYFKSDFARLCQPTEYAINQGSDVYDGNIAWWLRSLGCDNTVAAFVNNDGLIFGDGADYDMGGAEVNSGIFSVRPALWVSNI